MWRPSVAVVVPWRPSPGRERNLEAAACALRQAFGTYEPAPLGVAQVLVELADSGHDPFNRAASRNAGVRGVQADVVVVLDGDVMVEQGPLHTAIQAAQDGKLHLPYTECRMLSQRGTAAVLAGTPPDRARIQNVFGNSVGGCVVVAYDTWRDVGGWDERFAGWGFEDTAFWAVVDTLHGTVRHPGTLYDLWHPDGREIGSPRYLAGKALCDRYTAAQGDVRAMRELVEERVETVR